MTKFFRPLLPSGPQPFYREIKKDIYVFIVVHDCETMNYYIHSVHYTTVNYIRKQKIVYGKTFIHNLPQLKQRKFDT